MMFIWNFVLNLLFVIMLPVVPFLLLVPKFREGFTERLGIIRRYDMRRLESNRIIWFHAASVGEAQALIPVINEMKNINPDHEIMVTTTSMNGKRKLQKELGDDHFYACLLPLDLNFIMSGFIKRVSPEIVVIVETEIWPNLINQVSRRGIPLVMVNGRISQKSFGTYKFFSFFFSYLINKFNLLVMQSEKMVVRLRVMGVNKGKLIMIRNTKYSSGTGDDYDDLFEFDKKGKKVIVAGSIRKDEEETVIDGFLGASPDSSVMILAPRHMNRIDFIHKALKKRNVDYILWTQISDYSVIPDYQVVVVDTIGELQKIYTIGDIALIGGGFKKYGGHNPMEAALNSMPIITGKNMFNFEDTTDRFVKAGGAFMVDDNAPQLSEKIKELLDNTDMAVDMGKKNREVIENFKGTAATTALLVNEVLLDNKKTEKAG